MADILAKTPVRVEHSGLDSSRCEYNRRRKIHGCTHTVHKGDSDITLGWQSRCCLGSNLREIGGRGGPTYSRPSAKLPLVTSYLMWRHVHLLNRYCPVHQWCMVCRRKGTLRSLSQRKPLACVTRSLPCWFDMAQGHGQYGCSSVLQSQQWLFTCHQSNSAMVE